MNTIVECVEHEAGGRCVLRVRGDIDLSNANGLQHEILSSTDGAATLRLDLTEIAYFDSQGLRLLTRLADALAARAVEFEIFAPPGTVARTVLDLTAMTDEINVIPRRGDGRVGGDEVS